jgi:hypothetical protein
MQPAAASWRTDAIVATRDTHLQRLAEINQTAGESEALNRTPRRAGQIRADFYRNRDIGRASAVESKPIAPRAETRLVSLKYRIFV